METYSKLFAGIAVLATLTATTGCQSDDKAACCATGKEATCCETAPRAMANVAIAVEEGVPGGVMVSTLTVEAKVIEIDHKARTATLQTPDGATTPIQVGPEAVNFPQVQKGDMVKAIVAEELLVAMIPAGMDASSSIEAGAAVAPEGAMPGGMVAGAVRLVATVVAIDAEARTATLQFDDGSQKTVPVRADIDLTNHKPGEKVLFQITEMVALSVEKK